jgi:ATP-dependent Zn protease
VELLTERRQILEAGAKQLLDQETITEKELKELVQAVPA